MKYDWSREHIESAVKLADSYSETLFLLLVPKQGNNLSTLKSKIAKFNIDVSHFTFKKQYKNKSLRYISALDYIKRENVSSVKIKYKLLKEGILENKCACCGLTKWNKKPIVLQLHHIDGNHNNNDLDNLQLLCPNCHSQTENYCGSANKTKPNRCKICGEEILKTSKYCVKCSHILARKVERPTKELLLEDKNVLKSFVAIGKKYNVSDNAVRKWFKSYGLL